jgi:hypothetical protein
LDHENKEQLKIFDRQQKQSTMAVADNWCCVGGAGRADHFAERADDVC